MDEEDKPLTKRDVYQLIDASIIAFLIAAGIVIFGMILVTFIFQSVLGEQEHSSDATCVSPECIKSNIQHMCENDLASKYVDCATILRCLELEEQIELFCAGGYSLTVVKT